jgi:diacylglycerol kinase (ATP)
MQHYTSVSIIYNPNSTGSGKKMATELCRKLGARLPKLHVAVVPTEYAGHAEELAYKLARKGKRPLVISASGDGGYHEVVNGVARAQLEGAHPTTGLLPAGNANDHFRNLHSHELVDAIATGATQTIDLLTLSYVSDGTQHSRFAHSYIGFGFTPIAGRELNKHRLNRFNQVWLIAKVLLFLQKPVRVTVRGHTYSYDSLIFCNVPKMSKVLTMSDIADATDGKFEIAVFRRRNKLHLILTLLTASTLGLRIRRQAISYSFRTVKQELGQLDGELVSVDPHSKVTVSIQPKALRCII